MKKLTFLFTLALLASCGGQPSPSSSASSQPSSSTSASKESSSESSRQSSSESSSKESSATSAASSGEEGEKYLFYKIKEGQTKDGLSGSPWLNPSLVGTVAKIEKPSEKDDFFIASNYDYLSTKTLAEGEIGDGGQLSALKILGQRFESLGVDSNKGEFTALIKKAKDLYAATDKTAERNAVKALIGKVNAITDKASLFAFLTSKEGASFPWSLFELLRTETGARLYDNHMGWSIASTIEPFFSGDPSAINERVDKLAPIMVNLGYSEADAKTLLRSGLEEERMLRNKAGMTPTTSCKVSELDANFVGLGLTDLFKSFGYADDATIEMEEEIAVILNSIASCGDTDVKLIKDALICRIGIGAKVALTFEEFSSLAYELDSNMAGYTPEMLYRELFIDHVKDLYDRAYIDNFETKERKQMITSLMGEVKEEYHKLLAEASWLSKETRDKAIEKVDAIAFDAVYPAHLYSLPSWTSNEEFTSFYAIAKAYREWMYDAKMAAFTHPELWQTTITMMNAVYYPDANSFVMYEGLLSTNSYSANDVEELYGSVGSIIGHEISHAFDNNGANYDKYGQRENWWTDDDRNAFNQKSQKVVDNWNKIYYKDNVPTWASKMLGEIVADMGGITVMLRLAQKKENFDYDKFFKAYSSSNGAVFSSQFIDEMFYGRQDEHPMNYLRVNNVLNQFPKFHETYGIKEGDKMYTAEADRLPIW